MICLDIPKAALALTIVRTRRIGTIRIIISDYPIDSPITDERSFRHQSYAGQKVRSMGVMTHDRD